MHLFRYTTSIYGAGDQLAGANWGLIPWFIGAAAAFCLAHLVFKVAFPHRRRSELEARRPDQPGVRVLRHALIDRLYHWTMAIAVFTLLGTAFLPIAGVRFAWLNIHWITGLVLALLVLIHIVRALVWQDWRQIVPVAYDVRLAVAAMRGGDHPRLKPGKYNPLQKLYHLAIAILVLTMVVTGLLMLLKIDTPFWPRNPYVFSAATWAIIYVAHDFAAMAILGLVIIHIYFGLRPDEWPYLRAMARGWMSRSEFDERHDEQRWPLSKQSATQPPAK